MAGGARWAIQTIIERFPNCRVFVCTPIQTADPGHNAFNLKKCQILKDICSALSVQVIDCWAECGITEKLENGHGERYLRDGLHPERPGQQLMGRYIAKEIRNNFF
jgi:lysophospholipase L1-like esterase